MKGLKILFGLLGVLIVIVALGVLAVPKWISSTKGKQFVLQKVNENAPGTLDIDMWSLGWGSGVVIERLSYKDDQGRTVADVKEVRVSKGLLKLAMNYKDVGDILVTQPTIYVYPPPPAEELPAGMEAEVAPPSEAKPREDTRQASASKEIPDIKARLVVEEGAVYTGSSEKDAKAVAQNINVKVDVDGWKKPIQYDVGLSAGEGGGDLSCSGNVAVGDLANFDPNAVGATTELSIKEWQLEETLNMLSALGNVPKGSGVINGSVQVGGSMAEGLDLATELTLSDLTLSGGPLKEDHPSIPSATMVVQGRIAENSLSLSNVTLRSNLATVDVSGRMSANADGSIDLKGQIDLAEITRQFPTTLGLKDSLKLEEGAVHITAKLGSQGGACTVDSTVSIDKLTGSSDGKPLSWGQPTTLKTRGAWGPNRKELENLELVSHMMTVKGKGTVNDLAMEISADLGLAMAEVKKFVELEAWDASGKLTANIKLSTDVEELADGSFGKPTQLNISCDAVGENLGVNKVGQQLVPPGPLSIQFAATAKLDQQQQPAEVLDPSITFSTWLGDGTITMSRVDLTDASELPTVQGLTGSGKVNLDLVQVLLRELEATPENLTFGGNAKWAADAGVEAGSVQFPKVDLELWGVHLKQDDKVMPPQDMKVRTSGSLSPETRHLQLASLQLTTDAGPITVEDLSIGDWNKVVETVGAKINVELNAERLLGSLGGFASLPEGRSVQAQMKLAASVAGTPDQGQMVEIDGTIAGLRIAEGKKELVNEEDDITLAARLACNGDNLSVDQLTLQSTPLQLHVEEAGLKSGAQQELVARGNMAFDLEVVTTYLNSLAGLDVIMTGKESRPFEFTSSWSEGEENGLVRNASIDLGFHADTIRGFGLDVADLDVPLTMSEGVAHVHVTGLVNEGQLTLHPTLDFNQDAGVITLAENSNVLTSVQLTEDVANELLAKFHPLFKGATGITGEMDLHMEQFYWPLGVDQEGSRRFRGELGFTNVNVTASGFLLKLLEVMKVKEQEVEIGSKDMAFECRDQRVHCSPLEFKVDKHDVSIEGSIGFDQTLDYYAKVPVTESLAHSVGVGGADYTNYLAGITINVPIRGTASDPDISARVLQDAVSDLAGQAAKKAATGAVKDLLNENIGEEAGKLLEGLFGK